jgi:hypothetical protein
MKHKLFDELRHYVNNKADKKITVFKFSLKQISS